MRGGVDLVIVQERDTEVEAGRKPMVECDSEMTEEVISHRVL